MSCAPLHNSEALPKGKTRSEVSEWPRSREECRHDGKRQLESHNFVSNPGPVSSQLCGLGEAMQPL